MNHRPFEDWLLDDQPLNPTQKRELDGHLRGCKVCSALAESNLALRSARLVSPAPGFANRWQTRLVVARRAQRRRTLFGILSFSLGGLLLLAFLIGPTLAGLIGSPAEWISSMVHALLFIYTTTLAVAEAGSVLFRVLPGFVPPFLWLVFFSALSGICFAVVRLDLALDAPSARSTFMKNMFKLLILMLFMALLIVPNSAVSARSSSSGMLDGRVIFGDDFTLESGDTLTGDLVVFGGNVQIEADAIVQGDMVVIGGNVTLEGTVNGSTVSVGGSTSMSETAVVKGDLVTVGGSLSRDPGSEVEGEVVTNIPAPDIRIPDAPNPPSPSNPPNQL